LFNGKLQVQDKAVCGDKDVIAFAGNLPSASIIQIFTTTPVKVRAKVVRRASDLKKKKVPKSIGCMQ